MNTAFEGHKLSFLELMQSQKIEIPIIQRDYAQGRRDRQEIRNDFLKAIHSKLQDKHHMTLDFIYGCSIDEESVFQPLDGQQRLTTLFLLHWYAAKKEDKLDASVQKILERFSYETRISSREFCAALVTSEISVNGEQKVSEKIMDSKWFFLSWSSDPTIVSMLTMIDSIQAHFFNFDNLWLSLVDLKLISFSFINLENIGLTDDLYIKMNARGELLTDFENFKASLQNHIKLLEFNVKPDFDSKIDNEWIDIFWKLLDLDAEEIDKRILKFIAIATMCYYSLNKETSDANKIIQQLHNSSPSIRAEHIDSNCLDYVIEWFSVYESHLDLIKNLNLEIEFWEHGWVDSLFKEALREDSSYTKEVLFFAQTRYLSQLTPTKNFNKKSYEDWMRVVRNIVQIADLSREGARDSLVRSPAQFRSVVRLINEISKGCLNIYEDLPHIEVKSTLAKEQVEEEKLKAKLISLDPSLKKIIHEAEDHDLMMGSVRFIFNCIGYEGVDFDSEKFKSIVNVFKKYLSKNNLVSQDKISNDFRRALLTIEVKGEYKFYHWWQENSGILNGTKYCLFHNYKQIEYFIKKSKQADYMKALCLKLVDNSMKELISNFTKPENFPEWQYKLVKERFLDDSKSAYFAITHETKECLLLPGSRPRNKDRCIKI